VAVGVIASVETIRDALQLIPASDRDVWIKVGMACKSELGDAGFELWDTWSRRADNYNARDARDSWRSFNGHGVTIGTLFHEAKAHGWHGNGESRQRGEARPAARRVPAAVSPEVRAKAARTARKIWKAAQAAGADHPYLQRKGIEPATIAARTPCRPHRRARGLCAAVERQSARWAPVDRPCARRR